VLTGFGAASLIQPSVIPVHPEIHPRRLAYLSGSPRVSTVSMAATAGPRAHVVGVIEAFRRLGFEVETFILGDRIDQAVENQGKKLGMQGGFIRQLAADLGRLAARPVTAFAARRAIGLDVGMAYERFASMQALGRGYQRHGIPWVLETQGPFFYEAKVERKSMLLTSLARRLELAAYRQCDVLVCVSDALKEIICEAANMDERKVVVVPNGVDPRRFDPERYETKRVARGAVVGYVGSVRGWQGVDLLIQAVADLRSEGRDVSAVIVGDGPDRQSLEAFSRQLRISGSVHFVGLVSWDDIPSYMKGFDIGFSGHKTMQIGHMYHSPLKLYEYAAMSLPIVAPAFADARSLVSDGVPGALFEPGDPSSAAAALRKVLDGSLDSEHAGRNAVLQHHSWDARLAMLLGRAKGIIASGRSCTA
jgi:glycosyltransferase involved in cell wall biosynthesis